MHFTHNEIVLLTAAFTFRCFSPKFPALPEPISWGFCGHEGAIFVRQFSNPVMICFFFFFNHDSITVMQIIQSEAAFITFLATSLTDLF